MEKILLLDYGYDKLKALSEAITACGFEAELAHRNTTAKTIAADKTIKGIILAGGPYTIYSDDIEVVDPALFSLEIPLLGLGRGMQVMIDCLGGTVTPAGYQYAPTPSKMNLHQVEQGLFAGFETEMIKPLGFDAKVSELPVGFKVLASGAEVATGDSRPFGAIACPEKKLYGIQYVMDVESSASDQRVLNNFLGS